MKVIKKSVQKAVAVYEPTLVLELSPEAATQLRAIKAAMAPVEFPELHRELSQQMNDLSWDFGTVNLSLRVAIPHQDSHVEANRAAMLAN